MSQLYDAAAKDLHETEPASMASLLGDMRSKDAIRLIVSRAGEPSRAFEEAIHNLTNLERLEQLQDQILFARTWEELLQIQ